MRSDAASRDATATSPYLIVNTLDDQLDGPGDMVLVAQAGPELSLREAIVLCNNGFEPPLIYFDGSVFSEVAGGVILLDVGLEGGSLPVVSAPGAQIIATENTVTVRGPALQRPLLVVRAPQVLISGVRLISNRQVLLADGANALNLQGVYLQSEASGSIPIARVMGSALVQISGSMVASNDVLDFVIENSEEIFLPYGSFIRVQLRITASPFSAFQSLSLSESDRGQPAIQIADSMECDFSDISLANMRGTGIQIATSNEVSFTRILGASCTPESPCEQSPLIDVQSGNEVEAHQIEAISWSNQLFRLAAGTNTGATPPVITGASGQLISGTSALGDNGTIDVYEVSERRQTYLGQAVVRQNTWSWALSDPAGPQRFFSATATTWLGSTSEASAVFRPDPPSNCGSASVLARHDFEPGDRTTWSLTNVDFRQGFAAYQGLGYVETIDDTSGSLSLIQPLDLSTASTAELRVMIQRSACCSSSLPPKAEVLTRRSVTASWQHLPLVVSSGDAWQQRQVDLGAFVGAPTLYLGLALDDGPAGYLRVDQVEICGY